MVVSHDSNSEAREAGRVARLSASVSPYLPFFLLSFLYLWLVVEPHLLYFCFGTILTDAPAFVGGWAFLSDLLAKPGGFVTYVAGFLSVGFYYSWLGAAILVAVGAGLTALSWRHLAAVGAAYASLLAVFPAVALFLIYSQYKHPLPMCLAVSLGMLLSLIVEKLPSRRPFGRGAVFCLIAAAGFWLGAGGTFTTLALMTIVRLVRPNSVQAPVSNRENLIHLLALAGSLAVVWTLAEYVFLLPARQTLLSLTPFTPMLTTMDAFLQVLTVAVYGFVPVAVLLGLIGKRLWGSLGAHPKKAKGRDKHVAVPQKKSALAIFRKPALAALPLLLTALGLYSTYDELRKPFVLSNCYWHEKRWDKILSLAQRLPKGKTNPVVNHDILRALYHTGRFPYDMFRFPLVPEALLLTHDSWESDLSQLKLSDLFLELGHVNMAQRLASELVATRGHCGPAIERMAWISIVKGQPATARVYLRALRKDPIRRGTADSLLHGLDNGFTPEQAARIDRIRSCLRDETAGVTGPEPVDQWLAALFEHNSQNRMAFEYLMACYLLTGRVDKITENVKWLEDLGYRSIPTLYEEAILIHYGNLGRQPDLSRIQVSPETLQRYQMFVQIRNSMRPQNQQAVLNRLILDFGSSYFFYYSFGRVGQT